VKCEAQSVNIQLQDMRSEAECSLALSNEGSFASQLLSYLTYITDNLSISPCDIAITCDGIMDVVLVFDGPDFQEQRAIVFDVLSATLDSLGWSHFPFSFDHEVSPMSTFAATTTTTFTTTFSSDSLEVGIVMGRRHLEDEKGMIGDAIKRQESVNENIRRYLATTYNFELELVGYVPFIELPTTTTTSPEPTRDSFAAALVQEEDVEEDSNDLTIIIVAAVAGIVVLLIIVILVVLLRKRKRKMRKTTQVGPISRKTSGSNSKVSQENRFRSSKVDNAHLSRLTDEVHLSIDDVKSTKRKISTRTSIKQQHHRRRQMSRKQYSRHSRRSRNTLFEEEEEKECRDFNATQSKISQAQMKDATDLGTKKKKICIHVFISA
jgi:hypothetical protein